MDWRRRRILSVSQLRFSLFSLLVELGTLGSLHNYLKTHVMQFDLIIDWSLQIAQGNRIDPGRGHFLSLFFVSIVLSLFWREKVSSFLHFFIFFFFFFISFLPFLSFLH